MSAYEFIILTKENYIKNQPKASEFLDDPIITAKSQQSTLLQRVPEKKESEKEKTSEVKAPETRENIQKRVLCSITMLNPHQTEQSESVLKKLQSNSDVWNNDDGLIEIDNTPRAIDASNFHFTLQQPTHLNHPDYKRILDRIKFSPDLVPNSEAKEIVKPKVVKTMFVTTPKTKSNGKTQKRPREK